MAAPQQHALTNTSCTLSASPAAFSSSAGSYGSGQPAFSGDVHGRVSVTNDRDVQSVVYPSTAVVPQPILAHSALRKTKPCSLCGTAALRSQSSLVPNSPISPQEQPVVLLHRLEDGLPEGDVDSLRAFGTIRLLPIHRQGGKLKPITDDSKHECERKNQSVASHTMAPGNLAYKSFKRGTIKKRTELPAGSRSFGDRNSSLTNEILRTYSASDDHHKLGEKLSEKTVKSTANIVKSEVDSGGSSHLAKKRTEVHVSDNARSRLDPEKEALGERLKAVSSRHNNPPQYSIASLAFPVSPPLQSSHRASSSQQTLPASQAEPLDRSATIRSPLSVLNNLSSPQTSTSSTTNIHPNGSTPQSCSTQDTIQQRFSPTTPMSVVCPPVVPLTTTSLSSSPSQNRSSPSAISPPESPSSPASPLSPPFMCSPSACDLENQHSSCSAEIQPSSPYSPCTLPSLPASPTSLPSSSESPPSPAPSIDSPPVSPATSSGQQSEASHNQVPLPCPEKLGGDPHEDVTNSAAHLDVVLESKAEPERSEVIHQYHVSQVSSMENTEELSDKSFIGQQEIAQAPPASQTVQAPSPQIHMPEDASNPSQISETEIQEDLCQETLVERELENPEESVAEVGYLKPDNAKCSLNSGSESAELEKNSIDSRNSLMKLVLKVKHPGKQQLPLEPEKKDHNKENGIPKIVLTLKGKGPNKEYSCSNRLRNESESCSGENVNNKKHKSKRNKRQKPKDKDKTKKIMKGDKHKRHLELFGEDSNDSCDTIPDKSNDHPVGRKHSKVPSNDAQEPHPSSTPPTLEEFSPVHDDRVLPPALYPSELPSDCAKDKESGDTTDSHASPADKSLSHSLPSLTPEASDINTVIRDRAEDLLSMEETEEVHQGQPKSAENSTQEAFKLTYKVTATRGDERTCSELKQEVETSQASPDVLHCGDVSHEAKQTEGQILRSRRSRHVKNTESGRNSDSCLWVSFGVNAPVPLPATDLPSFEPVFTCKDKMKLKESETTESKEDASSSQLPEVGEKSAPKTAHKKLKEEGKIAAMSDVIKKDIKQVFVEKSKYLPTEYSDSKTSHSHSKFHSSSSNEDSNCARSRIRSRCDPTHHHSRQSHKRPRKSEDSQEQVTKKKVASHQSKPVNAVERDDNRNKKLNTDSCTVKSATSDLTPVCGTEDVRMESEENPVTKEHFTFPNLWLPVSDNTDIQEDPSSGTSQSGENVAPNEVTKEPEKPESFKSEETSDDQYYRPKKIRKTYNCKTTSDPCNDKKSLDQAEDQKTQVSTTLEEDKSSCKDSDSVEFPPPEAVATTTPPEIHAAGPELSEANCDTLEVKTDAHWKPQEELMKGDLQPKSSQDSETSSDTRKRKSGSPTPQGHDCVTRVGEESLIEHPKHADEELKEETTGKQEIVGKDCLPVDEVNEKQETPKKEKEKRKKPRREKRKDSRPGSRCSVLQEAQLRREVEHEEERGRRLAQEIKGFNWLEQKIKNSSLLSSRSAPSTPTASPSVKESEPTSRTLSTPTATPSTQFTFGNKEEYVRKNSFSGNSGGIGLKRHLQTAVPPLVPSSKVTALPKRRQSLGPPSTPPCSAPSTLCSVTSVPSMTVQGAIYTCEPTHYRSEHGKVGPTLEKSYTSFGHEQAESDKATLYSSTSSTKATLYGVKDSNFEAFYDTVSANAVNYYSRGNSGGNIDTHYNIATSPAICFYGSAKYQELGLHPDKTSSSGSHPNSSIISTTHDSSVTTYHQQDTRYSPKPDIHSPRNSDWSTKQGSSPKNSNQQSGYSADSHSPQRFSHKQVLLRRAFQEMLKSEPNTSSTELSKEKQAVTDNNPTNAEMNKTDGLKCKEIETACSASSQSSSERKSPADITNLKSQCPNSAPLLLSNTSSSEITDNCIISCSPEPVTATTKSEKDLRDPVYTEDKISSLSTGMSEYAESVTCKQDSNDKSVKSESDQSVKENFSDQDTSVQNDNDNKDAKVTEDSKDMQSNVIDCIGSASADIDMKVLKEEICYKGDGKNKEDAEVQPSLLLSVLYKELMKTRQEVEKLRKVQELMLTEKGEKKADTPQQSCDNIVDANPHGKEKKMEKRKDYEDSDDAELKIDDDDECHYQESKRSKISIRSDLLSTEDSTAGDTTSIDTSALQNTISQAHQSSSPAVTNPSVVQTNIDISVITVESSNVPDTSYPSRISPAIPASSPGLSSNISLSPKVASSLQRGHARTSPEISSPGPSRTSPGVPKQSPTAVRASPGAPNSTGGVSLASPVTSVSPAIPSSPGIPRISPGPPRSSPGVPRMSPGLSRMQCGIQRASPGAPMVSPGVPMVSPGAPMVSPGVPMVSPGAPVVSPGAPLVSPGTPVISPGIPVVNPGAPMVSPGVPVVSSAAPVVIPGVPMISLGSSRNGLELMRNGSEAPVIIPRISQRSPTSTQVSIFNTPTNLSTENLQTSQSHSTTTSVQPKMTTVQSNTGPVPVPRFPQTTITSTTVPIISPTGERTNCPVSRISPSISKIDTAAAVLLSKTDTSLTDMSPTKLRSVFGISNSDVELMPVSVGTKQPLHEPQPQTFLKLVESQHHQPSETPLLLNAVQGARQDSGSKNVESSTSHGQVPFHNIGVHEDPKRISKTHQYVGEMKRHNLSTSDLPDHAQSICKQPPPLKPVPLLRRHSDHIDIHSVMHHQAMYPGTPKSIGSTLHPSTSVAEHKNTNAGHPFNLPQYSLAQYPMPSTGRRRSSENNSSERSQGYQQPVPVGMQHQYPHLAPGSSMMRSLGPDKATIFPIPPTMPTGIRPPFKPTTPPSVTRAHIEQFQNENFYRTNFSFFEKIREKFAHSCDNGVSAMDRLQSSTTNVEKTLQPQTFAPRVLVREAIPEASSQIPTNTFTSLHFQNPNQPPPNTMPTHQNPFSSNMPSGSSIHHIAQARLHTSNNQATSSIQRNSSSGRSGEKFCLHCPQQARFICSGCKKAWYCSEQCQREHWSIHSAACVS